MMYLVNTSQMKNTHTPEYTYKGVHESICEFALSAGLQSYLIRAVYGDTFDPIQILIGATVLEVIFGII